MKRSFLALLLVASLGAADLAIPGTDLRLPVPTGWTTIADPGAALVLTSPDRRLRLAVTIQPLGNLGEAAFAQRCLTDLQRLLAGLSLEQWHFAENHGGRVWSGLRYHFRLGEQTYHQALWVTANNGQGVCITLGGVGEAHVVKTEADRLEADLWGSRPILR